MERRGGIRGRSCCPLLAAERLGIRWGSTALLAVIGGNTEPRRGNGTMAGVPGEPVSCTSAHATVVTRAPG